MKKLPTTCQYSRPMRDKGIERTNDESNSTLCQIEGVFDKSNDCIQGAFEDIEDGHENAFDDFEDRSHEVIEAAYDARHVGKYLSFDTRKFLISGCEK